MTFIHYKLKKDKRHYKSFYYNLYRYQRIFYGSLIWKGRKLWAYNFFLKIKYQLKIKEKLEPNLIFILSLLKITPTVILYPYKISGQFSWVPLPITRKKKWTFGTKFIIKLLSDKYRVVKLNDIVEALISAIYKKGLSYNYKLNYYKKAIYNKPFIRYFK